MSTFRSRFQRYTLHTAVIGVLAAAPLQAQDTSSSTQAIITSGDVTSGRALVQSTKCMGCHRIGDEGSRLGPDLSDIGSRRSPDLLQRAIVAPDDEVLPENRFVRIVTSDGTSIQGKLLNQDAFSIQLMTPDERLKSYLKSRLREFSIVQKGLMPSFEGTLNSSQLADVVSYLSTLRGQISAMGLPRASESSRESTSVSSALSAAERIQHAEREPQNWLTYSGTYASQRYSLLNQLTRENVKSLTLKWVWRPRYLDKMESTPIVV